MTVVLVGATAVGKSSLAVELALRFAAAGRRAEVINADSMLLYRGMDIGTAKPSIVERRGVRHHLIDVLDVTETSTVADFQRLARDTITECRTRNVVPIVVGGSALYVRAIVDDFEFPGTDPALRAELEAELERIGSQSMHLRLASVDPAAAATIEPGNGRRIVRALEVGMLTGRPYAATLPAHSYLLPGVVQIGLAIDRAELDRRVAARVHRMWQAGLVDEVRQLEKAGLRRGRTASRALGYRQVLDFLAIPSTRLRRSSRRSSRLAGSPADRTHGSGRIREFAGCPGTTQSSSIRPTLLPELPETALRSRPSRPAWGTLTPWKTERHAALVVRQGAWHRQRLRRAAGSRSHDAGR